MNMQTNSHHTSSYMLNHPSLDALLEEMCLHETNVFNILNLYRMLVKEVCIVLPTELIMILTGPELRNFVNSIETMSQEATLSVLKYGFCMVQSPTIASKETRLPLEFYHLLKPLTNKIICFISSKNTDYVKESYQYAVYNSKNRKRRGVNIFESSLYKPDILGLGIKTPCMSLLPHYYELAKFLKHHQDVVDTWKVMEFRTVAQKLDTEIIGNDLKGMGNDGYKTGGTRNMRRSNIQKPEEMWSVDASADGSNNQFGSSSSFIINTQKKIINHYEKSATGQVLETHVLENNKNASHFGIPKNQRNGEYLSKRMSAAMPSIQTSLLDSGVLQNGIDTTEEYRPQVGQKNIHRLKQGTEWGGNNPRIAELKEPPYYWQKIRQWEQRVHAIFCIEMISKVVGIQQSSVISSHRFHKHFLQNLAIDMEKMMHSIIATFLETHLPKWEMLNLTPLQKQTILIYRLQEQERLLDGAKQSRVKKSVDRTTSILATNPNKIHQPLKRTKLYHTEGEDDTNIQINVSSSLSSSSLPSSHSSSLSSSSSSSSGSSSSSTLFPYSSTSCSSTTSKQKNITKNRNLTCVSCLFRKSRHPYCPLDDKEEKSKTFYAPWQHRKGVFDYVRGEGELKRLQEKLQKEQDNLPKPNTTILQQNFWSNLSFKSLFTIHTPILEDEGSERGKEKVTAQPNTHSKETVDGSVNL